MTEESQQRPKPHPLPNWRAIFSVHYHLSPPGYDETFLDCLENPIKSKKEMVWEQNLEKKKKKKLGRGQTK
jgi:hypothetical protein